MVTFKMEVIVMTNKLLTRKQAAAYLDVSVSTLARWARLRKGPLYVKLGSSARYRPSDLETFVTASIVNTVANGR